MALKSCRQRVSAICQLQQSKSIARQNGLRQSAGLGRHRVVCTRAYVRSHEATRRTMAALQGRERLLDSVGTCRACVQYTSGEYHHLGKRVSNIHGVRNGLSHTSLPVAEEWCEHQRSEQQQLHNAAYNTRRQRRFVQMHRIKCKRNGNEQYGNTQRCHAHACKCHVGRFPRYDIYQITVAIQPTGSDTIRRDRNAGRLACHGHPEWDAHGLLDRCEECAGSISKCYQRRF